MADMARDIGKWLELLSLGEYVEAFVADKSDADVLMSLIIENLKEADGDNLLGGLSS